MARSKARLVALAAGAALLAGGVTAASASSGPSPADTPSWPGGVNLDRATILTLQRAFDAHQLTSTQLTGFYLARIKALDPELHAVIVTNPQARAEAAASDRRRRAGKTRGPLDGISVLLKDNIDTTDMPTTAGSLALAQAKPKANATIVGKLLAAGAVIIGKGNLSEWANFRSTQSSSGWSAVGGQTHNPYVLDRTPSGSSSGPAAAVAANLTTVAVGTETDGSIVSPSSVNADVGIKPTLGLLSGQGIVPISHEQDTAGPIARNATDAAVLLGVLATRPQDYAKDLTTGALKGARIGLWDYGAGQSNETDALFAKTAARLRSLGATTVPVDLPYQDVIGANEGTALDVEFKHDINAYLAADGGRHPKDLAGLIAFNRTHPPELRYFGQEVFLASQATSGDLSDPAYRKARHTATSLARRSIDETLAKYHLTAIAAPTTSPATPIDLISGDHYLFGSSSPAAVGGYPDVTVPMGFPFGLPVGLSFMASKDQEPRLIALAYSFEQATRVWHAPHFLATLPE